MLVVLLSMALADSPEEIGTAASDDWPSAGLVEMESSQVRGGLVWTFVGRGDFGASSERAQKVSPSYYPSDMLLRTKVMDENGNYWMVTDYDEVMVDTSIRLREGERGAPLLGLDYQPEEGNEDPDEGLGVLTPFVWTHADCDPGNVFGNGNTNHYWWGEDRNVITSSFTARQKASVFIRTVNQGGQGSTGDGGQCSGVMVDEQWVLTAAHCVENISGNQISSSQIIVDRWDQNSYRYVTMVVPSPDYVFSTSSGSTNYDFALLKLTSPWNAGGPYMMDLSDASNSQIRNASRAYSLGYPAWATGCTDRIINNPPVLISNNDDDFGGVYSRKVRMKMDASSRQSGGPSYFCPQGSSTFCAAGETGEVVTILSGWVSWPILSYEGAKVPSFRVWADAIIANN